MVHVSISVCSVSIVVVRSPASRDVTPVSPRSDVGTWITTRDERSRSHDDKSRSLSETWNIFTKNVHTSRELF